MMGSAGQPLFDFDNTFVRDLAGLYEPWEAAPASAPRLLAFNAELAAELGADADALQGPDGVALLVGNATPHGATPVALAYAGHQFGGYSPRLGDGRALLIGEVIDTGGHRRDLHLKGSGRTPFARGGDGRAAVGPMLREYLISEAMHALAIPTTRALAVIATGDQIARETMLPGAVLARIGASHIRVGTFEFAARANDVTLVRRLADYSIARHYPAALETSNAYLSFLESVVEAQASLVAQWMLVGFIHGVMNTDNTTISGETIDYGPCAFMETFDRDTVFSSIDHAGRYAYGNQPQILLWNLARLAETLLPLIDDVPEVAVEKATEVLRSFDDRYVTHWSAGMRHKLGLAGEEPGDTELIDDFLTLLAGQRIDFTSGFRALSSSVRSHTAPAGPVFGDASAFQGWSMRHLARLATVDGDPLQVADAMDRVNPLYIPRNQLVEQALAAATDGDLAPFEQLLDVISRPFEERAGLERFAAAAPPSFAGYQTFCGT